MATSSKTVKKFSAGDIIIRQGDEGGYAFMIEKGRVEIYVERKKQFDYPLGAMGKGDIIGETALIDKQQRTATIRALEDCELVEISEKSFLDKLKKGDETVRLVSQAIITRYRDMARRAEILGSNIEHPCIEDLELEYANKDDVLEDDKIAGEFKKALKENHLYMRYQPIIDVSTGMIAGFEALMRWRHPEKGVIPPGLFIPVVENAGLMAEASLWAMQQACEALRNIRGKVGYDKDLFMSVNFSSTDLEQDKFVDSVYKILSTTDVSPHNLKLEVTERMLISQPENAKKALEQCLETGIDIVMDDFGTGYSSLTYLNAFPINSIKIDRSFIRKLKNDLSAKKLIKSVVAMSKVLELTVIAEGVEDLQEAALLRNMGCNLIQGYFYSKPLREQEVAQLLRGWEPVKLVE